MPLRYRILFVLAFLLVFALAAAVAHAADGGWTIARNEVVLRLESDGSLLVEETILADFHQKKRGIIRRIPVRYSVAGHLYSLRFSDLEVTDGAGSEWRRKVTGKDNRVRIRIGDPNTYLSGEHTYRISYRIRRAVLWEDDRAVLRWNAIGHEWGIPTRGSRVSIELPEGVTPAEVWHDAWTGTWGSRGRDFTAEVGADGRIVYTTGKLGPREGVTIEVSLPESAVPAPGWLAGAGWWLVDNFVYLVWPAVLLACFVLWLRRGRDAPGPGSVAVQYEAPDGMGPAEVGTLIDEKVDRSDISATIIDLAVRGFLRIERKPAVRMGSVDEYTFHKLEEPSEPKPFEKRILRSIFPGSNESVRLDELTTFHMALPDVRMRLYEGLREGGYFDGNPEQIRNGFAVRGAVIVIHLYVAVAVAQILIYGRAFLLPLIVSGLLSLATVLGMSRLMPRKTAKGRRAWEQIAGLEEYVRRAEAGRIESLDRIGVFERLLPYAMVFGMAERWGRAFEGIYETPPDWYQAGDSSRNSTAWLARSISDSMGDMNSNLLTEPRSTGRWTTDSGGGWSGGGFGGGGFSGGGFGGGGGSSW